MLAVMRTVSLANTTVTIAVSRLIVSVMALFASASVIRAASSLELAAALLASSSASTLGTTFRSETTSIVALPEAAARLYKAHLEKKSNKQTKSNREQVSLNDTKT
jgi:hypothetical protein